MVLATIHYDASGGSDTAASGSNQPTTAVTGASTGVAISTNADTTQTFASAVDLTGTANDGTDVLWIQAFSGLRRLFRITAFAGTYPTAVTSVTTAETSGGIEAAVATWAVGGVRQTLEGDTGRRDMSDVGDGWRFEFETGTYTTTALNFNMVGAGSVADGAVQFWAATDATVTISAALDGYMLRPYEGFDTRDISWLNTSTNINATTISTNQTSSSFRAVDCSFKAYTGLFFSNAKFELIRCDIQGDTGHGVDCFQRPRGMMMGCVVHDCGDDGVFADDTTADTSYTFVGNLFRDNTSDGLRINLARDNTMNVVFNNTFHDNGANGLYVVGTPDITTDGPCSVFNNIFTSNGRYGIEAATGLDVVGFCDFNAYGVGTGWENVVGDIGAGTVPYGPNDVFFGDGVDPYTDSAGDDYSLNDTADGGELAKNTGVGYAP